MKAFGLPLAAGIVLAGLAPAATQTLTIGLKSEATSMDPLFHQLSTNIQVSKNIFEALTTQDALQMVTPGLAESWEAVDDTTWRFKLRQGMGDVPQAPAFNDPAVAVGTGPYVLDRYTRGSEVVVTRYDDYWGGTPQWESVTMRPITSDGPRVAALLAGDVDMIESPPIQDIPRIEQGGFTIVDALSNRVIYLHMLQQPDAPGIGGTDGENPLMDARVRKAISMSINRQAITERIMGGYAQAAGELLPPPMFGTSDRPVEAYDPDAARALLAEAGYPDGFSLTLGTPNDRYINAEQVAQAVAQMMAQIGIRVSVDASTASQFFSRRNALEFPIYLAGWGASSGDMSSPLKSLVATYDGRYSNPEMDALLTTAMATIDDAARDQMLQDAQTLVLDDTGIIPLHYEQTVWAMKPDLTYEPRVDQYTLAAEVKPAAE